MWKNDFICYQSVFSKERCEAMIEKYSELATEQGQVGGQPVPEPNGLTDEQLGIVKGSSLAPDIRRSKIAWIHNNEYHAPIMDIVWKLALKANEQFGFHIDYLDSLQFSEYNSKDKGHYDKHTDTFFITDYHKHRKLSMVIQLSDPDSYEGGDFELYGTTGPIPKHAFRSQGSVIFFPSIYEHQVFEVTSGVRHSIVGWFEGPKWR